jgi:hypothetical protein
MKNTIRYVSSNKKACFHEKGTGFHQRLTLGMLCFFGNPAVLFNNMDPWLCALWFSRVYLFGNVKTL